MAVLKPHAVCRNSYHMHVFHIMAGKGLGGAETYAVDMMLALAEAGVEQTVVMSGCAPRFAEVQAAGIRVLPEVLKFPFRPLQKYLTKKAVLKYSPDLIHCWMRRAASLVPVWKEGPVIGWFGGYYNPDHFKKCSHLIGVTPDIVRHMVDKGIDCTRAYFVPTFPSVSEEPALDRAQFDTPFNAPLLLALSRLHPKKGLDVLIDAVEKLPGFYLWLAGEGPLRDALEAQVQRLHLQSRVKFLGWRTDRGALLRTADICVLPSRYEPFGTVILEAWAAKTPLVACRSAGPAGVVTDGVTGLLTPIDDVSALAAALQRVISEPVLCEQLKDAGYKVYIEQYTRAAVASRMSALYQKLVDEHIELKTGNM